MIYFIFFCGMEAQFLIESRAGADALRADGPLRAVSGNMGLKLSYYLSLLSKEKGLIWAWPLRGI